MTDATTGAAETTWSAWIEATDEQREHFKVAQGHRAWSRICAGCGEGDFLERKQRPTISESALQGRGFPKLPIPIAEGARPRRFRTPYGRIHLCNAPR